MIAKSSLWLNLLLKLLMKLRKFLTRFAGKIEAYSHDSIEFFRDISPSLPLLSFSLFPPLPLLHTQKLYSGKEKMQRWRAHEAFDGR